MHFQKARMKMNSYYNCVVVVVATWLALKPIHPSISHLIYCEDVIPHTRNHMKLLLSMKS